MEVKRLEFVSVDGKKVPSFFVDSKSNTALVLIHGYASSKNEMLGLGYELAEKGYDSYVIDLRGHGENENHFDEDVIYDVEGTIDELRKRYDKIVTVGHSLGGLLSLKSSSNFAVAISPPLMPNVIDVAKFMLRVNSCRVREADKEVLFKILKSYNPPERDRNAMIFYGSGESKGIELGIKNWAKGRDVKVVVIDEKQAKLPEIEVDAEKLKEYIPNFVSHLSIIHAEKLLDELSV